jgi:hypothetical protein
MESRESLFPIMRSMRGSVRASTAYCHGADRTSLPDDFVFQLRERRKHARDFIQRYIDSVAQLDAPARSRLSAFQVTPAALRAVRRGIPSVCSWSECLFSAIRCRVPVYLRRSNVPRTETKIMLQVIIGNKARTIKAMLSSASSCLWHNVFDQRNL